MSTKLMSIKKQFLNLVNNEHLQELFCEYAEAGIDAATDNQLIEAIPIVGTLTKGGKAVLAIRDRLFVRKLSEFLRQVSDIDEKHKRKFIARLEEKEKAEEFAEEVIGIIDRLDNEQKAKIVGELFRDLVEEKLIHSDFSLLVNVVDRVFLMDLHYLRHYHRIINKAEHHLGSVFASSRVLEMTLEIEKYDPADYFWIGEKKDRVKQVYKISPWGKRLVDALIRVYGEPQD